MWQTYHLKNHASSKTSACACVGFLTSETTTSRELPSVQRRLRLRELSRSSFLPGRPLWLRAKYYSSEYREWWLASSQDTVAAMSGLLSLAEHENTKHAPAEASR